MQTSACCLTGKGSQNLPFLLLILVFVTLGEIFDVLGRPCRYFHTEVQAHGSENFLDFVQRLAAKVRSAKHFGFGLLNEVADIDDVVVLQAVGRTDRKFQFVDLLEQCRVERQFCYGFFFGFLLRFVEVDENAELVLKDAGRESEAASSPVTEPSVSICIDSLS